MNLDDLAINTIRTPAMDAVQQAHSGHPGTPMALAPAVYTLWQRCRLSAMLRTACSWAPAAKCRFAIEAYEELKAEGISTRVVSMPSRELFEQDDAYR